MRNPTPSILAAAAAALALQAAHAGPTEAFEGAIASNAAHGIGAIPGTGLEVVAGYAWIAPTDPALARGNVLDLASGWYSPNFDTAANVGYSTVRSLETFDLLAGYTYTLTFDYSRQTFSAGNGPFDTSLTGSLGSHSVTYHDVAGFFYGPDWQTSSTSWVQATTELGAHVMFTASGPAGYSGMNVDNISMVGLAPTVPVPEPTTWLLMFAGLAALAVQARRRG